MVTMYNCKQCVIFYVVFSLLGSIIIPYASCEFTSAQNIETFYPFPTLSPSPSPLPKPGPEPNISVRPPIRSPPETPTPTPSPLPNLQQPSSTNRTVVTAVAATAASTFVVATLLFFSIQRYKRRKVEHVNPYSDEPPRAINGRVNPYSDDRPSHPNKGSVNPYSDDRPPRSEDRVPPRVINNRFVASGSNIRGVIVDESGLDVVYWKNLHGENRNIGLGKHEEEEEQEEESGEIRNENGKLQSSPIQEVPLLRGKSSGSEHRVSPATEIPDRTILSRVGSAQSDGSIIAIRSVEKPSLPSQPSNTPPPPPSPPQFILQQTPVQTATAVANTRVPEPPLPPPPAHTATAVASKQGPAPPPPPPPKASMTIPTKQGPAAPPPPPPAPGKKAQTLPPPPPPGGNTRKESGKETGGSSAGEGRAGPVKLKPLHWDKVSKNVDHSMIWDKIDTGSFRFDDDLMEALFGYVAANRKSPERSERPSNQSTYDSNPPPQIVLLDARKSQNVAIVLRSLAVSHKELLEAITDGHGLDSDTLEKLLRIAPTEEEQSQIIGFQGDPKKLADAESFLYHLLKAVPTAFTRIDVMHFRSNYEGEIVNVKESLQVLESGCKELRNRGLFMKLLEAILKAGNRMNAGTVRGNAQAFKLTSLQKLSDVKSTDGKTTLLHFVVQEVVRSEGKRCILNRNNSSSNSFSRSGSSSSSNSSLNSFTVLSKEDREKEFRMLGLPIVGGLSSEFTNVKKAAQIDYDTFVSSCSSLVARANETRALVSQCTGNGTGGLFVKEMMSFLDGVEEELNALREEQKRVVELVKRTTEYYQAGASGEKETHPFEIFVIIRDFLGMVDKACVEIARDIQKKTPSSNSPKSRIVSPGQGSSSPDSPASRILAKFPNLPEHFMYTSSSSDSDNDF